jgi:hypothetical protein
MYEQYEAPFQQFVDFMKELERSGDLPEARYRNGLTEKLFQCFCAGVRFAQSAQTVDINEEN